MEAGNGMGCLLERVWQDVITRQGLFGGPVAHSSSDCSCRTASRASVPPTLRMTTRQIARWSPLELSLGHCLT